MNRYPNKTEQPTPGMVAAFLLMIIVLSFGLRTYFIYDEVFTGQYVNFQGADSWYHVRAIVHLIEQFPHRITFDPYALFPIGQHVAVAPLYDFLIAGLTILIGLGSPSTELTYTIAAWFPAVLGSLVVLPVYFITKLLFDQCAGLIAAVWIAVLPGAFLKHSVLSYTDHHVAEAFFVGMTMLFFLLSLRSERQQAWIVRKTDHQWFMQRVRRFVLPVVTGFWLGCYLLTWVGGSLLVLILFIFMLMQIFIEYFKRRSSTYLAFIIVPVCFIALAMVLPFHSLPQFHYHIVSLVGALVVIPICSLLATRFALRRRSRFVFPVITILIGMVGIGFFRIATPMFFSQIVWSVNHFLTGDRAQSVIEATPLFYPDAVFTLIPAWEMFTVGSITTVFALIILIYKLFREGSCHYTLILVWTVMMILLTLRQQRFSYYLALNVAILSGLFWSHIAIYLNELINMRLKFTSRNRVCRFILLVMIPTAFLLPNVSPALDMARQHAGPHPDWFPAMRWLQENTPEPFSHKNFYTESYQSPQSEHSYPYPESAYGIMNWWDHGYWIQQISRRIPIANPTQAGACESAKFFVSQSEEEANRIMDQLGARYVVTEYTLPVWENQEIGELIGKFGRIIEWAGLEQSEFYEIYYAQDQDGHFKPKFFFYPSYYRSMLTRLYLFAGQAYMPANATWAIQYSNEIDLTGIRFKKLVRSMRFKTYKKAEEFVAQQPADHWRIAGIHFSQSCVPLNKLNQYLHVYSSPTEVADGANGKISYIEIFEKKDSGKP